MERVVQQTDYDALSCRISAIYKGYLPSPCYQLAKCGYMGYKEIHMDYINGLKHVSRRIHGKVTRTLQSSYPVMNYGTYLRTVSIDLELNGILSKIGKDQRVQILDLGGGSDLRMVPLLRNYPNLKFVDVDYSESTKVKSKALWETQGLREFLKLQEPQGDQLVRSDRYELISCDLNDLNQTSVKLDKVTDADVPTIIITECVLCYMTQDASQKLIEYLINHYKSGHWVSYDPIGGSSENDRFGTIMQANLRDSRNLEMPTLMIFNSKEKYANRFAPLQTSIQDMWELFNKIPQDEIKRLKSLQFLDELEELKVMQTHYVFCKSQWGNV
ncbi:hypothetical protein ZYGR_0N05540 [Zygosaccharomyces rouxii]|uniref:Leucine carboxyl methyltransferase 1 n=2 Tax=Zygosaccharomyces rouxii TaxID=4956 RepID=C5DW96_ZYGRC|nr:uncharacterized protein ZYRO0D13002g [Zygosaccharomyces rouxii]KAH9200973.1 S-adenosyl-L-methionine-dependent methyltransferase [Zygosaccharomyces rouxii]GAV49148.1 hypothetical protein ZYGR_0N05540 [Zygosaccharomyces rouxii]CAR28065.1 ZYRO0D13002p [Zygosaccharomyces rouxii]